MTRLEEIEKAVAGLEPEELAKFRRWFEELDARLWDEQIKQDAEQGKLENLARQALDDHKQGRTKQGGAGAISAFSKLLL